MRSGVQERIADPLSLSSTLSGYLVDRTDPRIPRIVNAYLLDKTHPKPIVDAGAPGATTHFPATGLLTTVDDLARYMIALDENGLLTRESYTAMTEPFVLNDGRKSPYGLGWSTQVIGGQPVHWHYGYGDSYSALLIRVPRQKVSFILLCNSGAASAPSFLATAICSRHHSQSTFWEQSWWIRGRRRVGNIFGWRFSMVKFQVRTRQH